jgi:hypothetical protein
MQPPLPLADVVDGHDPPMVLKPTHNHSYDQCPLYLDDQHGQPLDWTTVESSHSDRTVAEAFHSNLTFSFRALITVCAFFYALIVNH